MSAKRIKNLVSVLLTVGLGLSLVGCGQLSELSSTSGSGSSGGSSGSSNSSSDYSGSSSLSGSVAVFGSDLAQVQHSSEESNSVLQSLSSSIEHFKQSSLHKFAQSSLEGIDGTVNLDAGVAYLHPVDEDGSLFQAVSSSNVVDGDYEFNNIADDTVYVVRVIKTGEDSLGNETYIDQTSVVTIHEGETEADCDVTPRTEYNTAAMLDTLDRFSGDVDKEKVDEYLELAEELFTDSIAEGDVRVRSRKATLPEDGVPSYNPYANVDTTELLDELAVNDQVADKVEAWETHEILNADDDIDFDQAKKLISLAFGAKEGATGSDHGGADIPDFILNSFAQQFMAEKNDGAQKVDFEVFIDAYIGSINDALSALKEGESGDEYVENIREAIDARVDAMRSYYAGDQSEVPEIFSNEDFHIVEVLFNEDAVDAWVDGTPDSQESNVAQGVLMFKWMGLMEDSDMVALFPESVNVESLFSNLEDPGDFFNPYDMCVAMGYVTFTDGEPELMFSHVMAANVWHNDEVQSALYAEMAVILPGLSEDDISVARLRYTDLDDETQYAELSLDDYGHGGEEEDPGTSALQASQLMAYSSALRVNNLEEEEAEDDVSELRYRLDPWDEEAGLISDFKSGDVKLELLDDEGEVLLSVTHTVYKLEGQIPRVDGVSDWRMVLSIEDENDVLEGHKISWEPFETMQGTSVPAGHTIRYAVELGLQAQKRWDGYESVLDNIDPSITWENLTVDTLIPDYSGDDSWDRSEDWDWSDDWSKWEKVWSSWDRQNFKRDTSFKVPVTLAQTLDSDDFEVHYGMDIRPVLVNDDSNEVVWEGQSQHFAITVEVVEEWTATLNGTVYFPEGYFDENSDFNRGYQLEEIGGTWNVGIFEMYDKFEGEDLFWMSESAPTPLVTNNVTYMVELEGTGSERTYEFPAMDADNNPFDSSKEYQLVVWFDQAAKDDRSDWDNLDAPTAGALDFYIDENNEYHRFPIEDHMMMDGMIFRDGQFILAHSWSHGYGSLNNLSTDVDAQEINIYFHTYYHDVVNDHEFEVDLDGEFEFKEDGTFDTGLGFEVEIDDEWQVDTGFDDHDNHEEEENHEGPSDFAPIFSFEKGDEYDTTIEVFIERNTSMTIEDLVEEKMEGNTYELSTVVVDGKDVIQVEFSKQDDGETYYYVVHLSYKAVDGETVLFIILGRSTNSDTTEIESILATFAAEDS